MPCVLSIIMGTMSARQLLVWFPPVDPFFVVMRWKSGQQVGVSEHSLSVHNLLTAPYTFSRVL